MRKKLFILLLVATVLCTVIYAATIKYTYAGETTYVETNGFGGGTADLASDEAYDWGSDINCETNGYMLMWVWLEYDSAGTDDNIVISYQSSYDGTNFDDTYLWSVEVDATSGANEQIAIGPFVPPPHGRMGVADVGGNDTFDYQITYMLITGDAS